MNDARIPVSLLTGFLGAGKTTLLNFLLRHPAMTGTAVVINEYGEVGLDHHLVEPVDDEVTLIEGGCMCCTARGQVVDAMRSLLAKPEQTGLRLNRVVIETTGLAEPGPILQQVMYDTRLTPHFRIDSVVTVVDAVNGLSTLDSHDIAVAQVAAADRLLVSKADLADEEGLAALKARLATLNPDAAIEQVAQGAVKPAQLFRPASAMGRLVSEGWIASADRLRFTPVRGKGPLLVSAAPPADQDIQTFSIVLDDPLPTTRFFGWLDFMRTLCGPTLLRVKGLVNLEGEAVPTVVHGVQSVFHPVTRLQAWPDEDRRSRLVFITRGWGRDVVAHSLSYLERS